MPKFGFRDLSVDRYYFSHLPCVPPSSVTLDTTQTRVMSSLHIQPSPPPSPTEEDIGRAGVYADSEAGASTATLTGITERQRQKRRAEGPDEDDNSSTSSDEAFDRKESYPPTNDDKTESRRVEEVRSRSSPAFRNSLSLLRLYRC